MIVDIFYPVFYGLFFSSVIYLVFRKKKNILKSLYLIPLLAAIVDYGENLFIALSFARHPDSNPALVSVASAATQGKWMVDVLLIISLIITLVAWVQQWQKRRKNQTGV